MVEFALVLPLLAVLLFGIIQFGIVFTHFLSLTDAVRVGARQGAVSRTAANPAAKTESAVRAAAANLDQGLLAVSVSSTWLRGEPVVVRATYPYEIDLLGVAVQSGRLESETTERVE